MRYLIVVLALTGVSLVSVADTALDPAQVCLAAATTAEQQQDCCKANKGICGCRAGKIVCCDKTFADDCSC
jgi:hypothetical protein